MRRELRTSPYNVDLIVKPSPSIGRFPDNSPLMNWNICIVDIELNKTAMEACVGECFQMQSE